MRRLLRQPHKILRPRYRPLTVIVFIAHIVQEAYGAKESFSFDALTKPILKPCAINSNRAVRCEAEHTG